ncbi:hypothetical protein PISMIDRAFT_688117 [Pisolithus microcarpus 441]|uniref:Uncharacterized protein n=1 Tax=Pisolithus microcarpus 441 TaxID=765257 RepID=A0A0C9YK52_9AGAM|nr:hypothetical protein BKA83DRAFT_690397 [Pisolithus microcarpus]KIK11399.1 hypothetical protein PISMIDRAFT_690397 [Pisolithus microcarpus 441]KIK14229.1 hypothetical protein PISMIDRAFT_688117 [Pisolithus microcarpus 441]
MTGISSTDYTLAAAICATVPAVALKLSGSSNLDYIPSVGYSSWPLSSVISFKYANNAAQILQESYAKHKGAPFKVPILNRWIVVVGRQHLGDIKQSTDDELSLIEAANGSAKVDYLIGPEINSNPYHISVARIHPARNLGLYYPNVKDEVHAAFEELLDLKDNVWKSVPAVQTVWEIVSRASNRVFVGLPLCRDDGWIDLNSRFAVDVATDANISNMFRRLTYVFQRMPPTAMVQFMTTLVCSTPSGSPN